MRSEKYMYKQIKCFFIEGIRIIRLIFKDILKKTLNNKWFPVNNDYKNMYLIRGSICKAPRKTNLSSAEVGLELEARRLR